MMLRTPALAGKLNKIIGLLVIYPSLCGDGLEIHGFVLM
jgi:hypothetical protein